MELTRDEVAHVAELARLALTEDELTLDAGQLSDILGHIQKLQAVDVSNVEATAMAVEAAGNVVRPDLPRPATPRERILANAAETEDGQFRCRAILEDNA
jgi:aspartyl-tRNA(Asn)/glutamyl-tRNA(Gln) amidotransferase subunit C